MNDDRKNTATTLIHEMRNALVPLDYALKRLFDFADELARDLNAPTEDLEAEGRARAEAILAAADVYRAGMEDPSVDAEQVEVLALRLLDTAEGVEGISKP